MKPRLWNTMMVMCSTMILGPDTNLTSDRYQFLTKKCIRKFFYLYLDRLEEKYIEFEEKIIKILERRLIVNASSIDNIT